MLTAEEKERYHRQLIYPNWGESGQKKLKKAVVFIAGAGGLGNPVACYLAASGVGFLRICDDQKIEPSNLNRQILYREQDIGSKKVVKTQRYLEQINSNVRITHICEQIAEENIDKLIGHAQILVDCLDNYPARAVLNQFAVRNRLPLVHAGVNGMHGQITFIHPPETPCLNCFYPNITENDVLPVIGATPGVIGCLQVLEVLKFLTGIGETLKNRLLHWDGENMIFDKVLIKKNPECRSCSRRMD